MIANNKNIFIFGDSIAYGQLVSVNKTWAHKVADWLDNQYVIQNSSIMGNTTRDALNRIYNDVLFRSPNIVYIQFGMNDCNIWQTENGVCRVERRTYISNIEEIVQRCTSYNASVIVGNNHPSNKNLEYDLRNSEYNELIRDYCNIYNIPLMDNELYCKSHDINDILLPDGIHLSEFGHDIYFNNFKNIFTSLYE
jgi:lysophospholipase L1-like esterase